MFSEKNRSLTVKYLQEKPLWKRFHPFALRCVHLLVQGAYEHPCEELHRGWVHHIAAEPEVLFQQQKTQNFGRGSPMFKEQHVCVLHALQTSPAFHAFPISPSTIGNAIIAKLIPRSSSLALAILINCFWRPI